MRVTVEGSANLTAEHDESLRPFAQELRIDRGLESLCCPEGSAVEVGRTGLRLPGACERRHQCGIAAQRCAVSRDPVNDHIEAAPIIRVHTGRRGVHQPLLWHYLAKSFQHKIIHQSRKQNQTNVITFDRM